MFSFQQKVNTEVKIFTTALIVLVWLKVLFLYENAGFCTKSAGFPKNKQVPPL